MGTNGKTKTTNQKYQLFNSREHLVDLKLAKVLILLHLINTWSYRSGALSQLSHCAKLWEERIHPPEFHCEERTVLQIFYCFIMSFPLHFMSWNDDGPSDRNLLASLRLPLLPIPGRCSPGSSPCGLPCRILFLTHECRYLTATHRL